MRRKLGSSACTDTLTVGIWRSTLVIVPCPRVPDPGTRILGALVAGRALILGCHMKTHNNTCTCIQRSACELSTYGGMDIYACLKEKVRRQGPRGGDQATALDIRGRPAPSVGKFISSPRDALNISRVLFRSY
jgi:hypothetical protein|eukprot:6212390-Prymnesium_polylepis.3